MSKLEKRLQEIMARKNDVVSLYLKGRVEALADMIVRAVAFPLPPMGNHTVFMPDAFMSKVVTTGIQNNLPDTGGIVSAAMTEHGPAFVFDIKLSQLLKFEIDNRRTIGIFQASPVKTAVCATVSFYDKYVQEGDLTFVDKIDVNSLGFGSSCNRGSHFVVPDAPYITTILQLSRSKFIEGNIFSEDPYYFYSPDECAAIFPNMTWADNYIVDSLVSYAKLDGWHFDFEDENLSYSQVESGLGAWAAPYLLGLRKNKYTHKEALYASLSTRQISVHASQGSGEGQRSDAQTVDFTV